MTTTNTVNISEIPVDQNDKTKTAWGASLSTQYYFAIANGTSADETFDAADIGAATKTLMATYGRGVTVSMGGGSDTVIGSDYGDTINGGDGTNYIDGGANLGTGPGGARARDVLNVFAASQAAADSLAVTALTAGDSGADGAAYAAGYRIKVSNGSETDYLKNVEQVNVFAAQGSGYTFAKTVRLAVDVSEADGSQQLGSYMDLAWAQGTPFGDTFNAATDVSSATRTLMDQTGRGVWVDTGAGDDNVTGSAYGDDISVGSGTNYVDGGANAGSPPWGGKAADVLHVTVGSRAAADAVQVVELSAASTGVDGQAFAKGYTLKVLAGGETDYVKGIERISVQVADANGGLTWARDIALAVVAQEADLSNASANYYHLAWVQGTANADTIDASAGSALLSSGVQAAMAARGRGVWIDGGAGNDTITGSAWADNIRNGAGNARIDGGANAGPDGQKGMDVFEITVASSAEMGAVAVAPSDDPNYQWMVTYGAGSTQKDYLKNIEAIVVNVNGTSTGKWIPLAVNVQEIAASGDLVNSMHYAWVQGTAQDDTFNAATDVSAATRTLMDQHGRGVYVDLGAGNDTVTGSGYGDDINVGAGTNYVDGGANAGLAPWGGKAVDTLHVTVASQAEASAVQVVQLAAGSTGADAQALANGYAYKVVAGAQTDYIKGIERVSVMVDSGNGSLAWARDIPLAVVVQEANLADQNSANYYHLAWVNGTAAADTIDAGAGSTLLSDSIKAAMDASKRGVWIDGGAGGDTITGSAWADNIRNGAGNDKVDGGANAAPDGQQRMDVFEISVASSADMAAVRVAASDDPNYQWMVTYGAGSTQKDYLKNIEAIVVNVTGTSAGKWIPLALQVQEAADATQSPVAWAFGTDLDDSFDPAASLSATARANLDKYQHGIYAELGAGNDSATGTAYGDEFNMGAGTNYVDGGANNGTAPWGGRATDVLYVNTASKAAASAVQVTTLGTGMAGADADAFAKGYTHKVVADGETDYIKGIERIVVMYPDGSNTMAREIALAVVVDEASLSDANIGNYYHLAWVTGTAGDDSIDAGALLTDGTKAAMDSHKRGVWIDGGAGNDTITGSAYADNIRNGAGNAKIDGGANAGPAGQKGMDVFEVSVASSAEMSAVRVQVSDDPNYQWMVTYGANSTQKDYLKNIEGVSISVTGTSTGKWIPLALNVGEADPAASGLDQYMHMAWVEGTALDETFNAATDLSAATRTLMDQHGRGVYVDMGAGNDTVTGSAYGDNFVLGTGTNYLDGGDNGGSPPHGGKASDVLEVYVASQAEANAVTVTQLTAAMTGADGAAWAAGYRLKLAAGGAEVDYLKGVETVNVFIWNDQNGDGQRGGTEMSFTRSIALVPQVTEVSVSGPDATKDTNGNDLAQYGQLAWARGTAQDDVIDASGLSATTQSLMAKYKAGMSIDSGAGNDILAGTPYADNFVSGAGVNKIDGGANEGVDSLHPARDTLDVYVDSQAAADAVAITELTAAMTGADGAAYAEGYRYKVSNGSVSTDYLKNVESVSISIWNDKNGNGQRDYSGDSAVNEVTRVRTELVGPQPNTAPVLSYPPTARADGYHAVRLYASVGDAELNKIGNYAGASLTLSRHGGASADDQFIAVNGVSFADGVLSVNGTAIGHVANAAGQLTMTFEAGATQALVNKALAGIAYMNGASSLPATVTLDWAFSDGNSGAQGTGGSLTTVASTQLQLGLVTYEIARSTTDPTTSTDGTKLANIGTFAWAQGTPGADSFDAATGFSQPVRALMDEFHKGAMFDMGPGDDVVKGTPWADYIVAGGGTNRIDGGGNGTAGASDALAVYAPTAAAAQAVQVTALDASATGADKDAFTAGYTIKVVNGSEVDYLKNMQQVYVWAWNDANGDHVADGGELTSGRTVPLAARVTEVQVSATDPTKDAGGVALADRAQFATIYGSAFADTIDPAALVSSATRSLMDTYKRGVIIDTGAGDDKLAGTAYADRFYAGAGTNYVDGGANDGITPLGLAGRDSLMISLAQGTSVDAVQPVKLTSGMSGADGDAYAAGYTWKIAVPGETDYVKGIETVQVTSWIDANNDGVQDASEMGYRSIYFTPYVSEVTVNPSDPTKDIFGTALAQYGTLATVRGTTEADVVSAALVSANTQALMAQYKKGVSFDTGTGDDVLTGSGYGDEFVTGQGVNKVDGGANDGGTDKLKLYVANQAAADAVTVTALTDAMTGDDGKAYAEGYRVKVTNGTASTDYLKNVEAVTVWILTDKNGNGQMDPGDSATLVRTIDLGGGTLPPGGINTAPKLTVSAAISASGLHPAPLAGGGTIFDNELAQKGSYEGAVLTVSRHGGANADDVFLGEVRILSVVSFDDGVIKVGTPTFDNGVSKMVTATIGTVTNGGGTLKLVFGAGATQQLVSQVLHAIHYVNQGDTPPASVALDWTLSDGNGGSQGSGGPLVAAASTQVTIELLKSEVARDAAHPDLSTEGVKLAVYNQFGTVQGTARGETFNAGTDFSEAARALMDEFKHGAWIATGGGGDNVTGTGYGDTFELGKGVNYLDGGANVNGADLLFVSADSAAAVDAAQVTKLAPGMQGADADAFSKGYTYKVVTGAETDYIKNIETVHISGMDAGGASNYRQVGLITTVEASGSSSDPVAAMISGTVMADQIDASASGTLLPDAVKADMAATGRGVMILGGDGDDVITGSSHPDFIVNGKGNAKIDGGAEDALNGATSDDVFSITVASVDAMKAVKIEASDDANYTWKVTYGPNSSEVDYLKNIEAVSIDVANGTDHSWISLKVKVMEQSSGGVRDAYIFGTSLPDVLNASAGGGLISTGLQARMDQDKAGVAIDGGAGNDVITGTAYVDSFTNGPGSSKIDGGANASNQQTNGDEFQILLPKAADVDAVTVLPSDDPNYQFMVTYGNGSTEKDYLKNVEMIFAFSVSDHATRQIPLAMSVQEVRATDPLDALGFYAHVVGTNFGNTFDAAVDVSSATRALMTEHQRGVGVDMGAGNDKAVGTAYSDYFVMGAGVNYVDGGANASGFQDTLHVYVTSQAAADAVAVSTLSAGMSGADKAAFDAGYTYKLVSGNETDYVKNVANYHVNLWIDANGNGYMDGSEVTSTDHVFGATPVKVDLVGVPTV